MACPWLSARSSSVGPREAGPPKASRVVAEVGSGDRTVAGLLPVWGLASRTGRASVCTSSLAGTAHAVMARGRGPRGDAAPTAAAGAQGAVGPWPGRPLLTTVCGARPCRRGRRWPFPSEGHMSHGLPCAPASLQGPRQLLAFSTTPPDLCEHTSLHVPSAQGGSRASAPGVDGPSLGPWVLVKLQGP